MALVERTTPDIPASGSGAGDPKAATQSPAGSDDKALPAHPAGVAAFKGRTLKFDYDHPDVLREKHHAAGFQLSDTSPKTQTIAFSAADWDSSSLAGESDDETSQPPAISVLNPDGSSIPDIWDY